MSVSVHLNESKNCFLVSSLSLKRIRDSISRVNNKLGVVSSNPNDAREVS